MATIINHPFCVKPVRGEWSLRQLQTWVKVAPATPLGDELMNLAFTPGTD
jgi:hypothetical protein